MNHKKRKDQKRIYRLYYFKQFYHLGEYLRVALILSGSLWENNLVTAQEWKVLKPRTPNKELPVLIINNG